MISNVNAETLSAWLADGREIALVDVRELGQFSNGHLFFACNLPYSRLEIDVFRLIPRMSTRVVLCADVQSKVDVAAAVSLRELGYTDVWILTDGVSGWVAAGYKLFGGVNVPSKTFGEIVEQRHHTPQISARQLFELQLAGDNLVILDGRPFDEYQQMNIPGASCCPNGELAYRIRKIVPDPATKIVVNCAGRTRSLIGAQTLINIGVPNPVYALENGTQGWFLEDLPLNYNGNQGYPELPGDFDIAASRAAAQALAAKYSVPTVDAKEVDRWLAEPDRTLFLFDVRTEAEFRAGSLQGARHAPGGQLVQAADEFIGVRHARVVLLDSDGVRAPTTASWMKQMGWDVSVLREGIDADLDCAATAKAVLPAFPVLQARELARGLTCGDAVAYDLRSSTAYRALHAAGSRWSIRPLLLEMPQTDRCVVLIADEPEVAALAACDLERKGVADVRILSGGFEAWIEQALPTESTPEDPPYEQRIDYLFFEHQLQECKDAAQRYLSWEIGLVSQLNETERKTFALSPGH
ncbi:rhodanese-like domain-containing protein [Castellaniella sp.]|uniref:rhodanese-like domain-containing protein n=1 Tax=Castellaniella sp. TaxID=1955812 RepID=UPI002AFDD976|nr:rhodanese-like domain-containing protein [Castellaniella sp.]